MPEEEKAPPAAVEEEIPEVVPVVPPPAAPTPSEPPENWESRFRYLLADFENFRRRTDRERGQLLREGRARLLQQFLPIYEASQRAREAVDHLPTRDPVRQGIDLLIREWEKFLRSEHVETVARGGAPFRAETMEAVAEAPATGRHPSGTVVEIVQQGYRQGDDLLRPAKVVVARSPTPAATSAAEPAESGTNDGPPAG
jgi:molecular chaperone GrpE